jgi:hypothetical protein
MIRFPAAVLAVNAEFPTNMFDSSVQETRLLIRGLVAY